MGCGGSIWAVTPARSSFDKAFPIIEQDTGIHFDASLAEIFLRYRPKLEAFYRGESAT